MPRMPLTKTPPPVLLAGPTASGKSALALAAAARLGGTVINADALQVYAPWRVLTARPSFADEAKVAHALYGHVALEAPYSVGRWLRELAPLLASAEETETPVFITGGSGLYFRALTEGLAAIPETPAELRAALSARQARLGAAAFFEELSARDPATADTIDRLNPRRVLRAREVLEATGKGLAAWAAETPPALLPLAATRPWVLDPPREILRQRAERRFDDMLAEGALNEVRAVMASGYGAEDFARSPGLKAIGAEPLRAYLCGETDLAQARQTAIDATRQYAKRQATWFRNQCAAWPRLDAADPDAALTALTTG